MCSLLPHGLCEQPVIALGTLVMRCKPVTCFVVNFQCHAFKPWPTSMSCSAQIRGSSAGETRLPLSTNCFLQRQPPCLVSLQAQPLFILFNVIAWQGCTSNSSTLIALQDVLAICGGTLPAWCRELVLSCKFLFPFELRRRYFHCTSFGIGRALQHLQSLQTAEGGTSNNHSHHDRDSREVRLGRLARQKV